MPVLAAADEWWWDAFQLNDVTNGRPLSTLAFALLTRHYADELKGCCVDEVSCVVWARRRCACLHGCSVWMWAWMGVKIRLHAHGCGMGSGVNLVGCLKKCWARCVWYGGCAT
eukprot:1160252-Pelagomonas_calceolata.AAC.16